MPLPENDTKLPLTSSDVNSARLERLREIFPDVFAEGKIDFEKLRQRLTNDIAEGPERYGLSWAGKSEAIKNIQTLTSGTLLPAREESMNFDSTQNIIIEGDNLEVLKLLQGGYHGRVKMIYIDPPYNTGSDFIYPDNYKEGLADYLRFSGQTSSEGVKLTTSPETDGRFHSKWLTMMYPRLFLARNLLAQDGLIVAQIGDNELSNLRKIMDEIFGEENYINTVAVKAKVAAGASGGGEDKRLKKNVEFLLISAKELNVLDGFTNCFVEEPLAQIIEEMRDAGQSWKYTNILIDEGTRRKFGTTVDGDGNPIEIFIHEGVQRASLKDICEREGLEEKDAYIKYLSKIFSDTNAQTSIRTRVIEATKPLENGQMYSVEYVPTSGRDKGKKVRHYYISPSIRRVIWLGDVAYEKNGEVIKRERTGTLWDDIDYNNIGKEGGVEFPNGKKPVELLERILRLSNNKNDIVLDFFAGSGTTAHSVLELNEQDGGSRQFILVQLPEPTESKEFPTIAEIAKERVRQVVKKLDEKDNGDLLRDEKRDRGFKVFKLSSSNFKVWDAVSAPKDATRLAEQLKLMSQNVIEGRTDEALLYELILKGNLPLTSKVTPSQAGDQTFYDIEQGTLAICLERKITQDTLRNIIARKPKSMICLDVAFAGNDQLKTNIVLEMKSHGIEFHTA